MTTTDNGSGSRSDTLAGAFPTEVVTHALVRDVAMPGGAGTMALITLDNGLDHTKPSSFGPAGVAELGAAIDALRTRAQAGEIQAAAVTGKPFIFAVGADLVGAGSLRSRDEAFSVANLGHRVFGALSALPVPTFAFVNGATMGGGLELALSADYRTVSAAVPAISLPECLLGIVPGWGGCWMLPNLVGPAKAIKVIIENSLSQNKQLSAKDALDLGIADVMFGGGQFLAQSIAWAAEVVAGRRLIERTELDRAEAAWEQAVAMGRMFADLKTGGATPAPYRALELISAARTSTRSEGFAAEDEVLADLLVGPEFRAGLYAFDLIQRRAKRPAGRPDSSLARPVTKVGIVGAGLMASQLALLFVTKLKVPVVLTDLDQARVDKGVGYVLKELESRAAKGRLTPDKLNRLKGLVAGSTSKDGFADADFVIEAVFEDLAVKKQVFAEVEAVVGEHCVLATNTSSLSISAMAADLAHPERVVGFHFFNPVAVMPLLEIIPGSATDDATLATAFATGRALGKTTIRVGDSPSFVVNRLLGRFMGEVGKIVDEGTPVEVADQAFAGLAPMPPFQLLALVGPAIALHNGETLARAFPDRFSVAEGLRRVVAAGKTGFYTYGATGPVLDPEVAALLPHPEHPAVLTAEQVREQVLSALAEEAGLMLREGVVSSPLDLDLAMITGAGFQFWNGGLTPLLDRTGVAERVNGQRFLPPGAASLPD